MSIANEGAARAWNGYYGEHWIEHEERYNASLRPYSARLCAIAAITSDDDVLDVGCGCGESTREDKNPWVSIVRDALAMGRESPRTAPGGAGSVRSGRSRCGAAPARAGGLARRAVL